MCSNCYQEFGWYTGAMMNRGGVMHTRHIEEQKENKTRLRDLDENEIANLMTTNKKIDFTLMPVEFHDVVRVLQQAHESGKYEKNGWQEGKDFNEDSNYSSIQRHLDATRDGIFIDDESKLHHDLHIACRALMSYTLRKRGKL